MTFDPRSILKYLGPDTHLMPTYVRDRAPTSSDIKDQQGYYQVPSRWIYDTGDIMTSEIWELVGIDQVANWVQLAFGSGALNALRADDGNTAVPSSGIIDIDGNTVANSTNATPLFTRANVANTIDIDVQVAAAIAATDATKVGLAAFDSAQFTVDANGFVQIAAGGSPINTILTDDASVVVPDGAGQIDSVGNVVAAATHAKPVFFHRDAVTTNELDLDVQVAADAAMSDINNAGLASFSDSQFSVDANGYVTLVGGVTPPTLGINVDANTPPGTDPVLPNGSGIIQITGAQVAAGTVGANVLRTDSLAANAFTIEIQRSAAVSSTASANNGVCHFDDDYFTVDANAFVSLTGLSSFFWIEVTGTSENMIANRGYVANNAGLVTLTLPVTAAFGTVIRVSGKGAGLWRIAQNASQQIHLGSVSTTAGVGGRIDAADRRDTIELLCTVADTEWTVLSSVGTLTIT